MKHILGRRLTLTGAAIGLSGLAMTATASPASADYWTETKKQWVAEEKGNGTIAVQYQGGGRWKGHITARDTTSNGSPIKVSVGVQYFHTDVDGVARWSSHGGTSVETAQGQYQATKYFDLTAGQTDTDTERVRLWMQTCEDNWGAWQTCTNRWYAAERRL